jgi:hypothetical protein
MRMLGHFLRTALGTVIQSHPEQQETLLGQIREISKQHGKVFEGLHDINVGIPVHIR